MTPKISVIIPTKDDHYLLPGALSGLNPRDKDIEVLIIDDGSYEKVQLADVRGGDVKVHRLSQQKGVGHAFDYGVKKAKGDIILLMGSDIIVDHGWKKKVIKNAEENPKSFTCSTCVVIGDTHDEWEGKKRNYGATLSVFIDADKKDILQCKWLKEKQDNKSYEIPALLGTCYAVKKDWYEHIGGWGYIKTKGDLNKEETKWMGHRIWGGLEPMISLKSWFAGGSCRIDPSWQTGHIFGRGKHIDKTRGRRWDMYYFNKLLMAHTLFTGKETKKFDEHLLRGRNENLARMYISRNKKAIEREKLYNDSVKMEDYTFLEKKFELDFGL